MTANLKTPKSDLLDAIQNRLVRLGCIRFRDGESPRPSTNDMPLWAITLFEQSFYLHQEAFDDQTSTAAELRLSRQLVNIQMTVMMAVAQIMPERIHGDK